MKYKVIFYSGVGSARGLANAEFYVKNEAIAASEQWVQLATEFYAYLWDGDTWLEFSPIP